MLAVGSPIYKQLVCVLKEEVVILVQAVFIKIEPLRQQLPPVR